MTDFTSEARDGIRTRFAATAGVSIDDVIVRVMAASVSIEVTVVVAEERASVVTQQLGARMADQAAASQFLSGLPLTVEAIEQPPVTVSMPANSASPPPPPPAPIIADTGSQALTGSTSTTAGSGAADGGSSQVTVILAFGLIVIGATIICLICAVAAWLMWRNWQKAHAHEELKQRAEMVGLQRQLHAMEGELSKATAPASRIPTTPCMSTPSGAMLPEERSVYSVGVYSGSTAATPTEHGRGQRPTPMRITEEEDEEAGGLRRNELGAPGTRVPPTPLSMPPSAWKQPPSRAALPDDAAGRAPRWVHGGDPDSGSSLNRGRASSAGHSGPHSSRRACLATGDPSVAMNLPLPRSSSRMMEAHVPRSSEGSAYEAQYAALAAAERQSLAQI